MSVTSLDANFRKWGTAIDLRIGSRFENLKKDIDLRIGAAVVGRDRMIVGFKLPIQSVPITTNVVSSNPFMWGVPDTTLCDKVCQWLATGRWFSPPKVALSTIKPNLRIGRQFENLQKGHKSTDVCDVEIKHWLEAGRRSESYIKYFNNIPDQSFVVFHLQRIDFKV
jgi:hypothetical protein